MTPRNEPRRPSLATIVGSSLAVAAAGSLIAFGSLAEQAGLQGLAVGGLQPTRPERTGGGGKAITVPAPSTSPDDPRDALAELVRETIQRDAVIRPPRPIVTFTPVPRDRPRPERRERPDIEDQARIAVVEPVAEEEAETPDSDGPPYGNAYGHDKKGGPKKPKAHKEKGGPKGNTQDQPVYARTANEESDDAPKAPKMKKAKPAKEEGNGNGHAKHASNDKGNGKAKGKGHAKKGG